MAPSSLFSLKQQLTFYGAYHSNPVNITIHEVCVPMIIWTFQVLACALPVPDFFPPIHLRLNDYLAFNFNWPAIHAALYLVYYFILEPTAAALYIPQMAFSLLTATAFFYTPDALMYAGLIHIASWIAQFAGHWGPEGRAPALLDNLIGAVVLAPFFVHLEVLFALGYRPKLHSELKQSIDLEIKRVKQAEKASSKKL